MKKNNLKTSFGSFMFDLASTIATGVLTGLLWIARNFWKRYLGIETPIYKLWWKEHSAYMQRRLNRAHNTHIITSI